jgi:hypothetical protein
MRFRAECAGGFRRLKRGGPDESFREPPSRDVSKFLQLNGHDKADLAGRPLLSERGSRDAGYLRQPRWQLFATRISPGPKRTSGQPVAMALIERQRREALCLEYGFVIVTYRGALGGDFGASRRGLCSNPGARCSKSQSKPRRRTLDQVR